MPEGAKGHGTEIRGNGTIQNIRLNEDRARELIGSHFLANPALKVWVNESQITFNDNS